MIVYSAKQQDVPAVRFYEYVVDGVHHYICKIIEFKQRSMQFNEPLKQEKNS